MSETVKSFIGRVAVVEQEGSAVRVLLNEGETMYAARDLLAACGCAYPTKWCQREAKSESDVKLVKLPFPVNGKTGGASRRSVPMYFVTERCGRMILDIFGCSKETRAWIEGKVFACKLADDDLLLLSIGGTLYFIADIGLRMLSPRELYNAMGFPPDYIIDRDYMGNPYPKNEQVARCGNAVCPPMAAAVARANFPEYVAKVGDTITTMAALLDMVAV